jgi:hypothetical protein
MSETRISAGTRLYFTPIPSDFSNSTLPAIEKACKQFDSIESAYLVRCSLPSENQIRLVLVAVVVSGSNHAMVAKTLIASLCDIRCLDCKIDILPVDLDALPSSVVQIGTKVK